MAISVQVTLPTANEGSNLGILAAAILGDSLDGYYQEVQFQSDPANGANTIRLAAKVTLGPGIPANRRGKVLATSESATFRKGSGLGIALSDFYAEPSVNSLRLNIFLED